VNAPTLASRYADVSCEVGPVTFGHRFVFGYNLLAPTISGSGSATSLYAQENKIQDTLAAWSKNVGEGYKDCPQVLTLVCDHDYKEVYPTISSLKGKDQ